MPVSLLKAEKSRHVSQELLLLIDLIINSLSSPIEFRDDLAHGLGSTGGSRDDVLMGATAVAPGLGTGAVHCLLSGRVGVDCSLWGDHISQH